MLGKKFLALGGLLVLIMACNSNSLPELPYKPPYEAQDFSRLKGMSGFSNNALDLHFALYHGYVRNTNLIWGELKKLDDQHQTATPAYAELKRRFGWEFNGMRLHELYFGNLGGTGPLAVDSPLMLRIKEDFGSFDKWAADFKATGSIRGIGWVVLYEDPNNGRLFNSWINEHDVDHLTGGHPLLVMDVFEHAYMPDYGLKRGDYIDAFFENINWRAVEARLGP